MSNKKDGKVSIANILALIGLAAIGVVLFFGFMIKSEDGSPGVPILLTAIIVAALGLFLVFSIKAKSADNNPDKWKIVEWICLAAYIIVAAVSAPVFLHFFDVFSHKTELQNIAKSEIKAVDQIYESYTKQCKEARDNAVGQLENYYDSKRFGTKNAVVEVDDWINTRITDNGNVEFNKKNIDSWKNTATLLYEEASFIDELKSVDSKIDNWDWMNLMVVAKKLKEIDTNAKGLVLNKVDSMKTNSGLFPVITEGTYVFNGYYKFNINDGPTPQFMQKLESTSVGSVLGFVLLFVFHFMILLNYLVTRRANYIPIRTNNSNAGGISL